MLISQYSSQNLQLFNFLFNNVTLHVYFKLFLFIFPPKIGVESPITKHLSIIEHFLIFSKFLNQIEWFLYL
jgi:hypothetical protein